MVSSLNAALSGLRSAQAQMNLISTNIANATTPGYTRKILPQSDYAINGESYGVQAGQVRRAVNTSLQFDLYNQTSLANASNAQLKYLNQIQLFHGDPNDEVSLANKMQSMQNDFIALADNPTDTELLASTVAHAQAFAGKVNDLSELYTKLRNDVQTEMQDSVNTINNLLETISSANENIVRLNTYGKSTAEYEDQRDQALVELSQQMDISYYKMGDGRMVVQTEDGEALVDYSPRKLIFAPTSLGTNSFYPDSAAGIYIDNPTTLNTTQDTNLTARPLGGRLGGLLELRDGTLPRYQAELDEMAQKVATRFDEQGLRLFTDSGGDVPPNVAPPTVTGYAGFSLTMEVNAAIIDDPSLLRKGTNGEVMPEGSARIIDRIVKYTFGQTSGESAAGTANLDATGVATLFTTLGLDTSAKITGIKNIQNLSSLDMDSAIIPGTNDSFSIQLGAGTPVTITIGAGDTATDLVAQINTAFSPATVASLSATGRLVLQSDENITITDVNLQTEGLAALGLVAGTTNAQNPSFTVQLDDGLITSVPIASTDTSTQLLSKLNAIAGINASLDSSGHLQITTDYGAEIKLTDVLGSPLAAMGVKVSDIPHTAFRMDNIGASASITSEIKSADTLVSYGNRLISTQSNQATTAQQNYQTNEVYRSTLEQQITNESGVNLDEEMANLIAVQRIYGANAKMISSSIEMLQELINAI